MEYCVLAHLRRHGPAYGQDIARSMDDVLLGSEGTLYPLLTRLRERRWVETTWQESPSGPPRRYHTLTDAGRAALDVFLETWEPFRSSVDRLTKGPSA